MALIDTECDQCGTQIELVRRAAESGTPYPPCPACGGPVTRVYLPPRMTWRADPVVVYRAPDGTFRYPGATESASTAHYDRLGYTRVELRSAADVRRFERQVNQHERAENQQRVEAQHRQRESMEGRNRSDLFHRMKTMSAAGRTIAQTAINRNISRHQQERTSDPGFRIEVYSDDRSSRDESRGSDGRRRRD
mgnify:FL=1